jgi:hypothetical protein
VSTIFQEGLSQNALFVVRSQGIDPSTGREVYMDINGNTVHAWNAADRIFAGVQVPLYRGNLSSMIRYRNFTLNVSFAYHWGGVQYNQTLIDRVEVLRTEIVDRNVDRRVLEARWSQPGDVSKFRGIPSSFEERTRGTTRFVMEDRLFELQTASLEYRFDSQWLKKAGIQNLRVSVNANELFHISSIRRERGLEFPFARRVGMSLIAMF